eukprot:6705872-Pyramimonas_sp.AAC.2
MTLSRRALGAGPWVPQLYAYVQGKKPRDESAIDVYQEYAQGIRVTPDIPVYVCTCQCCFYNLSITLNILFLAT